MDTTTLVAPTLTPMGQVRCEVGEILSLGDAATGERRVVALTGGVVDGPELSGRVVAGGADWQLARSDGVLEIDAHYVIETAAIARQAAAEIGRATGRGGV